MFQQAAHGALGSVGARHNLESSRRKRLQRRGNIRDKPAASNTGSSNPARASSESVTPSCAHTNRSACAVHCVKSTYFFMSARRKEYSSCLLRHNSDASRARSPNAGRRCSSMWNGSMSVPYTSKASTVLEGIGCHARSSAGQHSGFRRGMETRFSGIPSAGANVSNTYQAGPKLLAACWRLLLARRGCRNANRAWGNRDQLDAQRIRIHPQSLPGPVAGVRFAGRRAACGGIGSRRRANAPRGNLDPAQSYSRESASPASAPPGQRFLYATPLPGCWLCAPQFRHRAFPPQSFPSQQEQRIPRQSPIKTAALQGSIRDASARGIAGALIALTNRATGATRTISADAEGVFRLTDLAPGTYLLLAEGDGFEKMTRDGLRLDAGDVVTLELTLAPSTLAAAPASRLPRLPQLGPPSLAVRSR